MELPLRLLNETMLREGHQWRCVFPGPAFVNEEPSPSHCHGYLLAIASDVAVSGLGSHTAADMVGCLLRGVPC